MKCEICHEREATVHSDFGEVCSKCYDVYEEAMTPKRPRNEKYGHEADN